MMNFPKPTPDFTRLRNVLTGKAKPDRLPLVDLFVDKPMKEEILGRATAATYSLDPDDVRRRVDDEIEFRFMLGYDYIDVAPFVFFGANFQMAETSDRIWISEASSRIQNRRDFEKHQWPEPEMVDYSAMEYAASRLPDGMMIIPRVAGVFENVCFLTGLEGLAYLLVDDPPLVAELFHAVGSTLLAVAENLVRMERVGAFFLCDDLGFRSGLLLSPEHLRQYVFPWHRKIARAARRRDLPLLFHCCGNIERIMDDVIDDIGINARHSFEDAILPVEEAVERYGGRIAILGGVDMDLLARGSQQEVRARVRAIIQKCAPGGRFALGTGNSVASYLRVENYLAMLDEAWRQ